MRASGSRSRPTCRLAAPRAIGDAGRSSARSFEGSGARHRFGACSRAAAVDEPVRRCGAARARGEGRRGNRLRRPEAGALADELRKGPDRGEAGTPVTARLLAGMSRACREGIRPRSQTVRSVHVWAVRRGWAGLDELHSLPAKLVRVRRSCRRHRGLPIDPKRRRSTKPGAVSSGKRDPSEAARYPRITSCAGLS